MGRALLPTLRENKRYVTFKLLNQLSNLETDIKKIMGSVNYAKSGIQFPKKNTIRCKANSLNALKAALCLSKNQVKIQKISGAIKG